jgi:hypothetical protein
MKRLGRRLELEAAPGGDAMQEEWSRGSKTADEHTNG